jgi:hypothetical protein
MSESVDLLRFLLVMGENDEEGNLEGTFRRVVDVEVVLEVVVVVGVGKFLGSWLVRMHWGGGVQGSSVLYFACLSGIGVEGTIEVRREGGIGGLVGGLDGIACSRHPSVG